MKAVVIDASILIGPTGRTLKPNFEVGDIVDLIPIPMPVALFMDSENGTMVLQHLMQEGQPVFFTKKRFAPLSDQDDLQLTEEEAEEIRKRQKVTLADTLGLKLNF